MTTEPPHPKYPIKSFGETAVGIKMNERGDNGENDAADSQTIPRSIIANKHVLALEVVDFPSW
jgi:hypothetical protein